METIKTECQAELNVVENADQLAAFWAKYLGKGGEVQKLMSGIKNVPNEEKKAYGQAVNEVKNWVQGLYDEKKVEIDNKAMMARYEDETLDVTLPVKEVAAGNLHPLTCIKNEIIDVFVGMGFDVFEGPEIEKIILPEICRIPSGLQKTCFFVHIHHLDRFVSWTIRHLQSRYWYLVKCSVQTVMRHTHQCSVRWKVWL